MSNNTISPRLCEGILKYLDVEEQILQRTSELVNRITEPAGRVPDLGQHQAGLASLIADMEQMHVHRQNLRNALATAWKCPPESVRLSSVQLETPVATARLQQRRENLQLLARNVNSRLQVADQTLRGWSGIVGFVLGELLGSSITSDRYAANGQRVAATRITGIDVRT